MAFFSFLQDETYDITDNGDGSFLDQAGVGWEAEELEACKASGRTEASCPVCGHWMETSLDFVADCPKCGQEEGIQSPLVQFGML